MKFLKALALVLSSSALLVSCGGGDTEDRLDVRDPVVRFIHAVPSGPNMTFFRADSSQADATNVPYKFVSHYYDVSNASATWSARPASNTSTVLAQVDVNPAQGNRYTFVALPAATSSGVALAAIRDPYHKGLVTDKARVRVLHANPLAPAVDVYLMQPNASLANTSPTISNLSYGNASPGDGNDSMEIDGATYRLVLTVAGSKAVLFNANTVSIANNADWLLMPIPGPSNLPADIRVLVAQGNDDQDGTTVELISAP
jgi:hypothetical protein